MDDQTLLARFAETQDARAFEELAERHAGWVKALCIRVLRNSHDAEEVTQECFLELARNAQNVHSSVAGWLHRAATSRSLNFLRSRVRRKVRERIVSHGAESVTCGADVTGHELHMVIDRALTELPDDLRRPMILHYLDGRSQREVATELGVNQSTISRRMHDALRQLRETLARAGYVATAPALMVLMQDRAAMAATDSVLEQVAVSGAAGKAGGVTLTGSIKAVAAALVPLLSYLVFGGWISLFVAVGLTLFVARNRPAWVNDLFANLGLADLYRQPTFCLSRWKWNRPPEGWRIEVLSCVAWSVFYVGLSFAFAVVGIDIPWGIVVFGGFVALGFFVHAARIIHRVHLVRGRSDEGARLPLEGEVVFHSSPLVPREASRLPTSSVCCRTRSMSSTLLGDSAFLSWNERATLDANTLDENATSTESPWSWFDAVQLMVIGLAGVGLTLSLVVNPPLKQVWPAMLLVGTIGAGMLLTGVGLCRRLLCRSHQARGLISVSPSRLSVRQDEESGAGCLPQNRIWTGTHSFLIIGVAIVVGLSIWVVSNPAVVRGPSLSLASLQTSMLGWMFYRVAVQRRRVEWGLVRRVALLLLVSCFVLNSGVCLANWFW